jgi:nitrate/TMAO reductase-like tetraheme cytochrome c subunit
MKYPLTQPGTAINRELQNTLPSQGNKVPWRFTQNCAIAKCRECHQIQTTNFSNAHRVAKN